jgi:predicted nucleic acid-binding protein
VEPGRVSPASGSVPGSVLVLDSGAVIALSRGDARARAVLVAAVEAGAAVTVPANVVAETLRGSDTDAPVHRVLRAVGSVSPVDEPVARSAGRLLGSTGSDATIDATVVATAGRTHNSVVLTGDTDLAVLAAGVPGVRVQLL